MGASGQKTAWAPDSGEVDQISRAMPVPGVCAGRRRRRCGAGVTSRSSLIIRGGPAQRTRGTGTCGAASAGGLQRLTANGGSGATERPGGRGVEQSRAASVVLLGGRGSEEQRTQVRRQTSHRREPELHRAHVASAVNAARSVHLPCRHERHRKLTL